MTFAPDKHCRILELIMSFFSKVLLLIVAFVAVIVFKLILKNQPVPINATSAIRYVPIGDSYTIGTGATEAESWPAVLTAMLRQRGLDIALVTNPAKNGWDTPQALDGELPVYERLKPNFATVLIGANDVVRGVTADTFKKNLSLLLDRMQAPLPNKQLLIILTIPDFTKTPAGAEFGLGDTGISAENKIKEFNVIISSEAKKRQLPLVDLFPLSQDMAANPSYTADDGLHPSAAGYARWAVFILPTAVELLTGG